MDGSSVWTAGELAAAVDVSREEIEELLEEGDIRGHNVGEHWVVLKREEASEPLPEVVSEEVEEGDEEASE
ncbi:MAG: hypothetical protein ACP5JG_16685 [Anaerolineae bacterium]